MHKRKNTLFVPHANPMVIRPQIVHVVPPANERPPFFRGYLWSDHETSVTPSASATETADPLPTVPPSVLNDPIVTSTLQEHPDLFQIITPISIDCFEYLLRSHPNHPFVDSVLDGLRSGFWPCADELVEDYPGVWDESRDSFTPESLKFLKE
jgi:hypothetical protein